MKSYSEMIQTCHTFKERFEYLKLNGIVGWETFGYDRYLNQMLYKNILWDKTRKKIIIRDNGGDLGIQDRMIGKTIHVHHINPITRDDILNDNPILYDDENLISTSLRTHNAIHYGFTLNLEDSFTERSLNDTCPWKT